MTRAEITRRALVQLRRDTVVARARLGGLLDAVAEAEARLEACQPTVLLEVNAELVETALRAQQQAGTDALTGLPNRVLFADRVEQAMSAARRDGSRLALLFADIDGLKRVNDAQGHNAGDQLLLHAARALLASIRESDTVCRHGGDEFLVLLPAIGNDVDATGVAEKISSALADPFRIDDEVQVTSASIGISVYPGDGESAVELIAHADFAMYQAKRRRPGSIAFYDRQAIMPADFGIVPRVAHGEDGRRGDILMRETNERLVLNAMQQSDYLAMVVHEFRNPLASISNAAALLQRPNAPVRMLESIGPLLARQVAHLSRLSSDLSTANTGAAGRFQIELHRVDLVALIESAIESCNDCIQQKGHEVELQLGDGPCFINGDPVRLAQVMRNLLDNACKYTPEHGLLNVSLRNAGSFVEVTVTDNGIGLHPSSLESVFDLFTQDVRGALHSAGGLGIGLAVVRQLIEDHGGHVEARSAGVDQGSAFVFTLPRESA